MKVTSTIAYVAAALFVLSAAGAPAYAAPSASKECKKLDESACGANDKCSWVKPTGKTILGKEKKAYCRAKPAKKAAPKSSAPSPQ